MIVQLVVVVRLNVTTREHRFDVFQELRVNRHDVLEVAVDGAILNHHDLPVALDDRRFDLANLLVDQLGRVNHWRAQNSLPRFDDALRAQAVGRARKTERRLRLLPRLQHRFIRPLRRERFTRPVLIEKLNGIEQTACDEGHASFDVLDRLLHLRFLLQRILFARARPQGKPAPQSIRSHAGGDLKQRRLFALAVNKTYPRACSLKRPERWSVGMFEQ